MYAHMHAQLYVYTVVFYWIERLNHRYNDEQLSKQHLKAQ